MNLLITLLNIAIFQGIILGVLILKSPLFQSKANKYLAYAIFSLSFSLLNFVLDEIGLYNTIPFLRFIDIIDSSLLFPVFIFLYVVHQIDHPIKNSKKKIWLFVPYLYSLICSILDIDIISNSLQSSFISQFLIEIVGFIQILIIFLFIPSILIYTYTFIKLSNNTQEKKWLTRLWALVFMLFSSWILAILSGILLDYDFAPIMKILTIIAAFLIHWVIYFGIFKFRLAKDQEEIKILINKRKPNYTNQVVQVVTEPKLPKETNTKKIESITEENAYFKKLESLCLNNQIYKDNTLDRDKVAEMLGMSSGYVSQLVNTVTGDNFSTYINRYRVDAVKDLILDSEFDNYSLLAIGLECGFSSKTTFHNSFKKIMGMTPNAYRKMHK